MCVIVVSLHKESTKATHHDCQYQKVSGRVGCYIIQYLAYSLTERSILCAGSVPQGTTKTLPECTMGYKILMPMAANMGFVSCG